jgi:uncharacterized protein (TIGR00730 family)
MRSSAAGAAHRSKGIAMVSIRAICLYCGSSDAFAADLLEAAFDFGRVVGAGGIELIYGGGQAGLMGRAADGALAAGGRVVGIIPDFLHGREIAHPNISELIVVDSMHERKRRMAERADAFVILPGGIGTLDEMFEILTWRQLGLHDKPIVLVDLGGYWQKLEQLLQQLAAEAYGPGSGRILYRRVDGIDEVLPALAATSSPEHPLAPDRL